MNGLNTNNAPQPMVVIPHFVFGGLTLLIIAILLVLADSELLGSYFNNKIVAITHMSVLGWGTMIVFGALYQLIPVVFETALFSEKLAKITFWLSGASILFLSYSMWVGDYTGLLPYAAIAMFLSLLLFVINVMLSYKNSKLKNIKSIFVITAVFWLLIAELIGLFQQFNSIGKRLG